MNILVVDDERRMATLVASALEDEGHEVRTASGGRQAMDALGESRADLVITDLKMAPPDGMALLDHCRALPAPPEVVMMTAHGTVSTAVEAMQRGAYDFITKPFELEEVVTLASRVADPGDRLHRRSILGGSVRRSKSAGLGDHDLVRGPLVDRKCLDVTGDGLVVTTSGRSGQRGGGPQLDHRLEAPA